MFVCTNDECVGFYFLYWLFFLGGWPSSTKLLLLLIGGTLKTGELASGATGTSGLVASTVGGSLILEGLKTGLLGLSLEDVLHQTTLVLEGVTLDLHVELVVEVLVDLGG